MEVTIKKWGNSLGIRLPKKLLDELGWQANQTVEITLDSHRGKIILEENTGRNEFLENLFKEYEGDYRPEEISWGEPQGKEVW